MAAVVLTQLHPIDIPGVASLPAQSVLGWQITPATAQDLVTAFEVAASAGYTCDAQCYPLNGVPTWTLLITKPNYPAEQGTENSWILCDGVTASMLENAAVAVEYTADVPLVWAATTVAPVATAVAGGTATLTFPQPTSVNAPWSYTVTQTNVTASTTGVATRSGNPVVADGNVTLTVTGLTAADNYTFTVEVATRYTGVTATSVASNQITATA